LTVDVYTKLGCAFCDWTKNLLKSKGIGYNEHKLGKDFTREFILENFPSARTFPIIIVDGFNVGGYDGLKTYLINSEAPNHNLQFLTESNND